MGRSRRWVTILKGAYFCSDFRHGFISHVFYYIIQTLDRILETEPFFNGCFGWMTSNRYMKNGCFTKTSFQQLVVKSSRMTCFERDISHVHFILYIELFLANSSDSSSRLLPWNHLMCLATFLRMFVAYLFRVCKKCSSPPPPPPPPPCESSRPWLC